MQRVQDDGVVDDITTITTTDLRYAGTYGSVCTFEQPTPATGRMHLCMQSPVLCGGRLVACGRVHCTICYTTSPRTHFDAATCVSSCCHIVYGACWCVIRSRVSGTYMNMVMASSRQLHRKRASNWGLCPKKRTTTWSSAPARANKVASARRTLRGKRGKANSLNQVRQMREQWTTPMSLR